MQTIENSIIDLELEMQWAKICKKIALDFDKKEVDLETILMLIGIQECGIIKSKYTKEQKQDLMHVAVCSLLTPIGCFEYLHTDADGWKHYKAKATVLELTGDSQENVLKRQVIDYFKTMNY